MSHRLANIDAPHDHDVLSGRGNFVNYHVGNEFFRTLVRKYKLDYIQCPKPQKGKFSRIIVDEIKARDPPGRFLKQDASTKLWYDIGDKKALDKTRQALREGAPEIIKEITGDTSGESDDEERPRAVQTDGYNIRGTGFAGDTSADFYMRSPTAARNGLSSSQSSRSPVGMISPGMMLGPLSPDMAHHSGAAPIRGGIGHMMDPSTLPGPPLQTFSQFDPLNQIKAQQQAAMMMNIQMSQNFRDNNVGVPGMMSQEQIEIQNRIQQQQMQLNLLQQLQQQQLQQQQSHSQMKNNQATMTMNEMRMMNMARMNMNNQVMPMPNQALSLEHPFQSLVTNQFGARPINNEMPPPQPGQPGTPRQDNTMSKSSPEQQDVETMPGNNPRRMPPTSLLKREDSIKMDNVFSKSPVPGSTIKVENGSSNHLSAMSLSIADMQEDGNLSSVFDSSLRISLESGRSKRKSKEKPHIDGIPLEMSLNTIGPNAAGDMSYASFNDVDGHDSDGDMSFGKVFEDRKD